MYTKKLFLTGCFLTILLSSFTLFAYTREVFVLDNLLPKNADTWPACEVDMLAFNGTKTVSKTVKFEYGKGSSNHALIQFESATPDYTYYNITVGCYSTEAGRVITKHFNTKDFSQPGYTYSITINSVQDSSKDYEVDISRRAPN